MPFFVTRVEGTCQDGRQDGFNEPTAVDARGDLTGTSPSAVTADLYERYLEAAWTDPQYRQRLLHDSTAAIKELGLEGEHIVVAENTPTIHNVVCCTLCSCYP